jgi:hypothetical protein
MDYGAMHCPGLRAPRAKPENARKPAPKKSRAQGAANNVIARIIPLISQPLSEEEKIERGNSIVRPKAYTDLTVPGSLHEII